MASASRALTKTPAVPTLIFLPFWADVFVPEASRSFLPSGECRTLYNPILLWRFSSRHLAFVDLCFPMSGSDTALAPCEPPCALRAFWFPYNTLYRHATAECVCYGAVALYFNLHLCAIWCPSSGNTRRSGEVRGWTQNNADQTPFKKWVWLRSEGSASSSIKWPQTWAWPWSGLQMAPPEWMAVFYNSLCFLKRCLHFDLYDTWKYLSVVETFGDAQWRPANICNVIF